MSEVEDLLRRTFADREHDLDGAMPSLAAVQDRARRRRRQRAAVLAGAATVAVILVGSTVALTGGPQRAVTGSPPTGAGPTGALPPYRPVEVTSAEGRTSAVIRWAPTWLPAGIGETGRLAGAGGQDRSYGTSGPGPRVLVTLMEPVVASTPIPECSGPPEDDARAVAVDVAGRPARLWSFRRRPAVDMWPISPATIGPGHVVCVPLAGGGSLWTAVTGTADTAGDAVRVAGSVRPAGPAEVAVQHRDARPRRRGPRGRRRDRPVDGPGRRGWHRRRGGAAGPDQPANEHHCGWSASQSEVLADEGHVRDHAAGADLEARLIGEFRNTTLAAATGLQLGATPDYSWFHR